LTPRSQDDSQEIFRKLGEEVAEWENSPYYLPDEELFDLERFLTEHGATKLLEEIRETYGEPVNRNFWTRNLAYRRLKKAREEIKAQEQHQDEKREAYQEALRETRKAHQEWIKEWIHSQRRAQIHLVRDDEEDSDEDS
jgi:uncharacterized membrane protein